MIAQIVGILFDGLAFGMLLFVLSVGLTVTLGLMNFINLAHGSFAMIGGYVTLTLMREWGWPFLATLPAAFLITAAISVVFERTLFRHLYRSTALNQVLLTIGFVFVFAAIAAYFYGTVHQPVQVPSYLRGSYQVAGINFATYRLFLLVVAIFLVALLIGGLEYTRFGARIRAAVDNQRVARGLGIDVDRIFAVTFALGSGLAGLGGALAIEIVGLDPSFGFHYLVFMLIVVAVGGLGSVGGSFAAAALLGMFDVAGKYYIPELGSFLIYIVLIVLLFFRPLGLFGKR